MMGDSREVRRYLKNQNLCKSCRKMDAYTMNDHTLCADCMEKAAELKRKQRAKNPYKYRDQQNRIRDRRREEYKCTRCGRMLPPMYLFKTCIECRIKMRNRKRNIAIKKDKNIRGTNGICYQCNKNPVIEGKKLCEDCYSMKLMYLEKAMETNRRKREES